MCTCHRITVLIRENSPDRTADMQQPPALALAKDMHCHRNLHWLWEEGKVNRGAEGLAQGFQRENNES